MFFYSCSFSCPFDLPTLDLICAKPLVTRYKYLLTCLLQFSFHADLFCFYISMLSKLFFRLLSSGGY